MPSTPEPWLDVALQAVSKFLTEGKNVPWGALHTLQQRKAEIPVDRLYYVEKLLRLCQPLHEEPGTPDSPTACRNYDE